MKRAAEPRADTPEPPRRTRARLRGWAALALALAALGLSWLYYLGPGDDVYWQWLRDRRGQLEQLVAAQPSTSRAAYFGLFFGVAALAVPITPALAIMGGLLFGRWHALLLVSCASTAGASVAFLLSRYLLAGAVHRRWGAQLEPIQRGIERDGVFYLLALRLSPLVPFSLVNLGMGLTPMPLRTFWWVSQLGMLPIAVVFVNAGAEAARVQAPRDILSPGMIVAFTLAALVPVLLRVAWNRVMRSRHE